jgi:predicted peptidase
MNATTLLICLAGAVTADLPSDDVVKQFAELTYAYAGGEYKNEPFKYRLLKPEKIEPGKKYPVVLYLHGAGERGKDNVAQLRYLPEWLASADNRAKYPCFLIAPQCRPDKKWSNVSWADKAAADLPAEPSDQMNVAVGILDEVLKSYPCDVDRVYLTGLSMGGYGSWDLAERTPGRFAAVAPVCGGGDAKRADRLVGVPVWAWHGTDDPAVPVERSRLMIEAIRSAGGTPKYTELPGVKHSSWVQAYHGPDNLLPWMFEQVRKPAK